MNLPPLVEGRLIRRYQRFLADVELLDGSRVTAHCPNTGSMLGLNQPGNRVWLSRSDNPARKLAWTWELVELPDGVLAGIHTGRANRLVAEALDQGLLPELAGYVGLRREARLGQACRSDLLLEFGDRLCHVEVKNVTAAVSGHEGFFPDAVSQRARKHLNELAQWVGTGQRAAVVFCVQRGDVMRVRPADHIDPDFGHAMRGAARAGVEFYALGAELSPAAIRLVRVLPVCL